MFAKQQAAVNAACPAPTALERMDVDEAEVARIKYYVTSQVNSKLTSLQ